MKKKIYIVIEAIYNKNKEPIDINIISVCKTKKEAESILIKYNPFTTKIKEGYMEA